ncbi:MAG: hypothetical protein LBQ74_09780 [Prevotella sp.]|jgi:hypothetical protein|nr:hypothetical protein [Prevotella sp.]
MKKKRIHSAKTEIILSLLLVLAAVLLLKCCSGEEDVTYADKSQTVEIIKYQQSEGRFAVEENGYINIRR